VKPSLLIVLHRRSNRAMILPVGWDGKKVSLLPILI
jgi:hypothetical protein